MCDLQKVSVERRACEVIDPLMPRLIAWCEQLEGNGDDDAGNECAQSENGERHCKRTQMTADGKSGENTGGTFDIPRATNAQCQQRG